MNRDEIESAWPKFPGYRITATVFDGTGRVAHGSLVLAESERCLVVAESDHLDQLYFPVDDVRWEYFVATDHHTICPFKGEAAYWSLTAGEESLENVAWSYPDPFAEVADLVGYVAFYTDRLSATVTEQWSPAPEDHITNRFPVWGTAADLTDLMDVRPVGEHGYQAPRFPDPPFGTFFPQAKRLVARDVIEGGQLLGDLIVAASKSVPDKRVTSAHAMFLKAASFAEPLDVDVEVLRDGHSVAAVDVRIGQSGTLRCAGMALLDAGSDDLLHDHAPMPAVAPPAECPQLDMSVVGRDLREVDGSYRARSLEVGPPVVGVWARFRTAPEQPWLQQALLAQAITHWTIAAAMRPHEGLSEADAHVTVSTGPLSASIAFHDDIDVTQWMLYWNPAIYSGKGSAQGEGRVYAIDGRLLASYSVQAMIRPFAAPAETMGGFHSAM